MTDVTVTALIQAASELTGVSVDDLCARHSGRRNDAIRFAVYTVAREHGHSYRGIAAPFNRDYKTPVMALKRKCGAAWADDLIEALRGVKPEPEPRPVLFPEPEPEPTPELTFFKPGELIPEYLIDTLGDDDWLSLRVAAAYSKEAA